MTNFVLKDGVPVFIGKEDPTNPPVKPPNGSKMECPVCHGMFDYLVGEDIGGGRMGCEDCWKPPVQPQEAKPETYDTEKEML